MNNNNNILEKMSDEDRICLLMFLLFNKDELKVLTNWIEKTEQWTKEAEEAGMTLTKYLESTSPLNKYLLVVE